MPLRRTLARAALVAALVAAPALALPEAASAATNSFRGVNWADARDNYVDGWVIPSGLTASDSYATVKSKADGILSGFQSLVGANTVRLPINPQSVNSAWWAAYKGTVDSALAHGMRVILSYWEANHDGFVDDTAAWNTMWDTVVAAYGSANVQYGFACFVTWFLILGGLRTVLEVQRKRVRRRAPDSDADQLERLTGVPGGVWVALFALVGVFSLLGAGRLLVVWPPV